MLIRTMNIDVELVIRLHCRQFLLKFLMFFWRASNVNPSAVWPHMLSQPSAVMCSCALDTRWSRRHEKQYQDKKNFCTRKKR